MASASELIDQAFSKLAEQPGFTLRENQRQLALLISDCLGEQTTGIFEAPTGLGKSLAALIPAIAHAIEGKKRTVIATYTNILAEQYWNQDVPLALNLFPEELHPSCQFLVGRQRYACLTAIGEIPKTELLRPIPRMEIGVESEFRRLMRGSRTAEKLWADIVTPPVCPARLCRDYQECYYYGARRKAEKATIIITNHNVVLQDALLRQISDGEINLLGDIDLVIFDEAHDLPSAAYGALEFELSEKRMRLMHGLVDKLEQTLLEPAARRGQGDLWMGACDKFRNGLNRATERLVSLTNRGSSTGILAVAPIDLASTPQISEATANELAPSVEKLAGFIATASEDFANKVDRWAGEWGSATLDADANPAQEAARNYTLYLRDFGRHCGMVCTPQPVSVTHWRGSNDGNQVRQDIVDLAAVLPDLIWNRWKTVSLSATLAVDGDFSFYEGITGLEPDFREVLPTPFDFGRQAALYLPPSGTIPDPTLARRNGTEDEYFEAIASELSNIITLMEGRTLALFHSRREMEAVFERMTTGEDLPILIQKGSGAATSGEKFRQDPRASLFGLRSFWTGFDAPGETLSCITLVRVPFEVPVDPAQIVRSAWMASDGRDPFKEHSLPLAKMMMRQGAGRLIRRTDDKGVIVILDPRVQTKNYGEAILANLPPEMRQFSEFSEAVAWLGLTTE